jgi:hypothetical protein
MEIKAQLQKVATNVQLQKVPLSTGNWIVGLAAAAVASFMLGWIIALGTLQKYCIYYSNAL